ncbi:MFS transporter, partial [Patescibacteria group bacterium]|nr:MFS transporter [Patescibacteria group bacterium]
MNIFSPKNTGVAGNIWKYAILYITNKRPYITFLTIFLLTFPDTTVKTIGLLSLVGQIAGFLLEVPSGYISDYLGHKRALVIAKISFLLSSLCYVLATSTWYFFVGAILLAIGIAMNSGTQSAFLKESLDDLNLSTQYSSISGKLRSIGFAIPILLILLVSFVGDFNFRIGFSIVLVTDLIGLITVCTLISPKKQYETEEFRFRNIKKLFKTYTSLGWLKYVFFIEFMFALGFGVTGGFKNPFQESLGFSVFALGVFWAISRVGISGVLLLSGKLKERLTLKNFIVIQACLYTILFLGIG